MAMRPAVMYTLYATSSKEQTSNVITFTQFEEGNILNKNRNDEESSDESDNESIMMIKQDMGAINYGDESDHDLISTDMLDYIRDGSQTHTKFNRREAHYNIRDRVRQKEPVGVL